MTDVSTDDESEFVLDDGFNFADASITDVAVAFGSGASGFVVASGFSVCGLVDIGFSSRGEDDGGVAVVNDVANSFAFVRADEGCLCGVAD